MPLSWNEIKHRARQFAKNWENATSEVADKQTFWNELFDVFGVNRRRVATFEQPVCYPDGKTGSIDLLWKGVVLVEHKSRGVRLDTAYTQARDYFQNLKDRDLPKYIIVSDFARFRIYDLDEGSHTEVLLCDLPAKVNEFRFLAGYSKHAIKPEDPINQEAVLK